MRTTPSTDRQLTADERAHGMTMLRERYPLSEIARALGLTTDATVRELRSASSPVHAHHWLLSTASQESPAVCKACGETRSFAPPTVAAHPGLQGIGALRKLGQLVDGPPTVRDIAPDAAARTASDTVHGVDRVGGAGKVVDERTTHDTAPGAPTIREQLGHAKLRFYCSRCEYEARHFGDIVRHYQLLHEGHR